MRYELRVVLAGVVAVIVLASFMSFSAVSQQPNLPNSKAANNPAAQAQGFFLSYPVKFVCGDPSFVVAGPDKNPILRHSIKPGNYATNINVHNPFSEDVKFRWKAILTKIDEKISDFQVVELKPNEGEKIDCQDIEDALRQPDTPPLPPFFFWEGIVVIETIHRIDVITVYTSDLIALFNKIIWEDFEEEVVVPEPTDGIDLSQDVGAVQVTLPPQCTDGALEIVVPFNAEDLNMIQALGPLITGIAGPPGPGVTRVICDVELGVGIGHSEDIEDIEPKLIRERPDASIR